VLCGIWVKGKHCDFMGSSPDVSENRGAIAVCIGSHELGRETYCAVKVSLPGQIPPNSTTSDDAEWLRLQRVKEIDMKSRTGVALDFGWAQRFTAAITALF